jgi:hypothetical protein
LSLPQVFTRQWLVDTQVKKWLHRLDNTLYAPQVKAAVVDEESHDVEMPLGRCVAHSSAVLGPGSIT